jgi:hypothetical protein
MKFFVILLVLLTSFLSINLAYGLWLPQTPQELLEESQVIFAGTITSVNVLEFEESSTSYVEEDGIEKPVTENYILSLDEYSVNVEEFLKNPQNSTVLTVRQPTTSIPGKIIPFGGFEIGDRVLFYIEEFDGINTYSKESFLIPEQCNSSLVIHEPRMIGGDFKMMQNGIEKQDNFTANSPIQFIAERDMGTLSGASLSYDAYISKQVGKTYKERVFNQTITTDSKPCEWISVATWEFTPDAGSYLLNGRVYEGRSNFGINNTFFSVWPESPLKQINLGKTIDEIKCKENLVLIQKFDGSPACVMYQTGEELVKRGWATCDDGISHGRGHPCGPRSSGIVDFDIESYKPVYPKFDGVTEIINPEHESLEYRASSPVIEDTYLSKNVQQWKDAWEFELQAEYEKYGDEFYTELGRLLMKNEMQHQMNNLGIVNSEKDFKVVSGMMLTSLPPHIGFSSIVHATDGHYYWLQGTTHANQVSYYKTTQLQYPDVIEVDLDKKTQDGIPKISILPKGNNDLKSTPSFTVLTQPGDVEFYNETPGILTVYLNKDGVDEFSFETSQQISVHSNSGGIWRFSEPGSYNWHGEVPTIMEGNEYELNTGGGILVLSDDMSDLSLEEQMETARMMLITSGLPITGMGQKGESDILYISFSEAINEILPESRQYYLERAQNLIPFDISIKLED